MKESAIMLENPIISTPATRRPGVGGSGTRSSILRRSFIPQNKEVREEFNDDDAERSSLLASERAVATSTPQSPRRGRDAVTSSPQNEHFQGCLKLFAQNKINKDNAWNLHLIDFMTSMLRKQDSRMDNLQTASTMVDASARIYSFRVDAVHYDVLKMAGGLCKAAQTKRGKKDDDGETQDDGAVDGDAAAPVKKKKKKTRGAIATHPEVLNGEFETNDCIDPFFERLAATAGDVTSSNKAFNATLPIDDKTYALKLNTDEQFLSEKDKQSEDIDLSILITFPLKLLPAFMETDQICEPFSGFSISNWDPDTEDTDARVNNWVEENRLNLSQQALAFDVNAEVEPIPQDDHFNDLLADEPLGGLECEEEAEVAVAACVARAPAARLADTRPAAAADARLEYSYSAAVVAAWAGPRHWRLKNNRASKQSERTHSTAAGRTTVDGSKKPSRNKRQLDFVGTGLAFDSQANPTGDYEPIQPAKIMISRKTLATGHTWNEANFKTPINRGFDESHFRKLFLRPSVMTVRKRGVETLRAEVTEPVTVDEARYDYNNENDASYCVNNPPDMDEWGNEEGAAAPQLHEQLKTTEIGDNGEIGEMLPPPTKVPKIFIPYAMRAKKVDMKQLKHCTWNILTENTRTEGKDDVTPTTFSALYSRLPTKLSTTMRESLSVPLALLSLLHLANEKGLILEKKDDLNDIGIVGLIKNDCS